MADTSSSDSAQPRDDRHSFFALKHKITDIKIDPVRWNRDWEKLLPTLSSKDVYPILGKMWKPREGDNKGYMDSAEISQLAQALTDQTSRSQKFMADFWDEMEEEGGKRFFTAWMLLEERERKRHLLKALGEACEQASWREDARAMCPEITFTFLLKQGGKGFIDLVSSVRDGKKDLDEGIVYLLPNEWWRIATDASQTSTQETETVFALLTIQRNEFIIKCINFVICSVLHDLAHGSPGMDSVKAMMDSEGGFARAWGKTLAELRDKPIIRCENCTKSPEEIEGSTHFALCSNCKSKLNFAVHYCSRKCQEEDWRNHKKHCGKKKVSKKLRGTASDPYWAVPDLPDHLRFPMNESNDAVAMSSIGFAPGSTQPQSPALQRQLSLITGDKEADYFIFDELERPIRFVVPDPFARMTFRMMRSKALADHNDQGVQAMAEYLVKMMGQMPGLGRERILAQLSREFGSDVPAKMTEWEKLAEKNGFPAGTTFIEKMGGNLTTMLPQMMGRRAGL